MIIVTLGCIGLVLIIFGLYSTNSHRYTVARSKGMSGWGHPGENIVILGMVLLLIAGFLTVYSPGI